MTSRLPVPPVARMGPDDAGPPEGGGAAVPARPHEEGRKSYRIPRIEKAAEAFDGAKAAEAFDSAAPAAGTEGADPPAAAAPAAAAMDIDGGGDAEALARPPSERVQLQQGDDAQSVGAPVTPAPAPAAGSEFAAMTDDLFARLREQASRTVGYKVVFYIGESDLASRLMDEEDDGASQDRAVFVAQICDTLKIGPQHMVDSGVEQWMRASDARRPRQPMLWISFSSEGMALYATDTSRMGSANVAVQGVSTFGVDFTPRYMRGKSGRAVPMSVSACHPRDVNKVPVAF